MFLRLVSRAYFVKIFYWFNKLISNLLSIGFLFHCDFEINRARGNKSCEMFLYREFYSSHVVASKQVVRKLQHRCGSVCVQMLSVSRNVDTSSAHPVSAARDDVFPILITPDVSVHSEG